MMISEGCITGLSTWLTADNPDYGQLAALRILPLAAALNPIPGFETLPIVKIKGVPGLMLLGDGGERTSA
jgi:hypothetical protein